VRFVPDHQTGAERPLEVPEFQQLDWWVPLSEPVWVRRPFLYESWAERPLEVPTSQHITWYQPLTEPLFIRLILQGETAAPILVPTAPIVPTAAWAQPLAEPRWERYALRLEATVAEPVIPWQPPPAIAWWHPEMAVWMPPHPWSVALRLPAGVSPEVAAGVLVVGTISRASVTSQIAGTVVGTRTIAGSVSVVGSRSGSVRRIHEP